MGTMEKEPLPRPNISLYSQLMPNITHLALSARISRPAIYAIVYGSRKSRPETVRAFNEALRRLLAERMAMAKKLSSRP